MPERARPVVVNTGPLLALRSCGRLELLRELHEHILVPVEVERELARRPTGVSEPRSTAELPAWADVVSLGGPVPALLRAHLDDGEAAVIALALERAVTLVVIDERRGRIVARAMGLEVTGSIGILLRAKNHGLLAEVAPCLEAMRGAGVWLSDRLVTFALREAGEI